MMKHFIQINIMQLMYLLGETSAFHIASCASSLDLVMFVLLSMLLIIANSSLSGINLSFINWQKFLTSILLFSVCLFLTGISIWSLSLVGQPCTYRAMELLLKLPTIMCRKANITRLVAMITSIMMTIAAILPAETKFEIVLSCTSYIYILIM